MHSLTEQTHIVSAQEQEVHLKKYSTCAALVCVWGRREEGCSSEGKGGPVFTKNIVLPPHPTWNEDVLL